MKSIIKYLLSALFLLSFKACDILDNDSVTIAPLDSKINFKVIESYDGYETVSTPEIFIEMQTEKIYGCFNYGIATNCRVKDRSIFVDIIGISKPDVCLTAFGPANGQIKLGLITGVYEIEFSGENFNDKYNLLISDSLIILDGKETPNTKPLIYFLHRYPENSFAYLCDTNPPDSAICEGFIDTLQSVINLIEFTFSDFAEIPYQTPSEYYNVKYFYYENESEFNKIEGVMKSYKQAYFPNNDGNLLSIVNWMNKKIYSWVF